MKKTMTGLGVPFTYDVHNIVLGCTKRTFPGFVKLGEKVAFWLPTAGRRMQFFHLIFTQPWKGLLVQPCKSKRKKDILISRLGFSE